jgi:hypothetical protein
LGGQGQDLQKIVRRKIAQKNLHACT